MIAVDRPPSSRSPTIWERFTSTDPLDVVPRLLAIVVIPTNDGLTTIAWTAGAILVAAMPSLSRSAILWVAVGGSRLALELWDWHGVDDHEALISYACIALGLALWCDRPVQVSARSLPLLVGLTMTFATGWKLGSGQFLDGDAMRHTLLTDPRFELPASWFGTMGESERALNDSLLADLRQPNGATEVTLAEPLRLTVVALAFTIGAVLLEALLAIAFLIRRIGGQVRVALLVGFCVSTYVIVPVSRFGIVLLVCAYAGTETRGERRALLATVAFCIVWPVAWVTLGGTQ